MKYKNQNILNYKEPNYSIYQALVLSLDLTSIQAVVYLKF